MIRINEIKLSLDDSEDLLKKKTAKTPVEKAPAFHGRPPKSTFI